MEVMCIKYTREHTRYDGFYRKHREVVVRRHWVWGRLYCGAWTQKTPELYLRDEEVAPGAPQAGEMAQSIKLLLCRPRDLTSVLSARIKSRARQHTSHQGQVDSLSQSVRPSLSERLIPKIK